jgi:hypothetical protein
MMDWCSQNASATDYTVQASAVVLATGIAAVLAGFSAQAFGYFGHFCIATALALGALAAVRLFFPRTSPGQSIWAHDRELATCT